MDRVQVSALIAVPLACVAASLWIAGEPLSMTWFTSYGLAASVTVFCLSAFNLWLWKLPFLQGWFVNRPRLAGNWKFTIRSDWIDPETGESADPVEAEVKITQTYTRLHLHLETEESKGDFLGEKIIRKDDGTYQVSAVYRNEPKISIQDRSRTHLGALVLNVIGIPKKPTALDGHYWTDRNSKGEINGVRSD